LAVTGALAPALRTRIALAAARVEIENDRVDVADVVEHTHGHARQISLSERAAIGQNERGRESRDHRSPHERLLESRAIVQRGCDAATKWSTFGETTDRVGMAAANANLEN
jgi:hypothetical protein